MFIAKKYDPSPKQAFWIKQLAKHAALCPGQPVQLVEPKPTIEVGGFAGVIALFRTAQKHLQFPKIRLQLSGDRRIVLAVARPRSNAPGSVNITDGKPFGQYLWYGRVSLTSAWKLGRKVDEKTAAELTELAKAPARVAAAYGKMTGNC